MSNAGGKKPCAGDADLTLAEDGPVDEQPANTSKPADEPSPGAGSSTNPFGRPFDTPAPRHLKKDLLRAKTINKSLAPAAGWVRICDPDGQKRATRVLQQGARHKLLTTWVQWDWQEVEAGAWQAILVKHNRLAGRCAIYVSL
jgi:hypothetical protein